MGTVSFLLLLATLSATLANAGFSGFFQPEAFSSDVPFDDSIRLSNERPLEQQVKTKLSPYAKSLHELLSPAGIFEKLFNSSFTPCEAEVGFQYGIMYFTERFGVPNPEGLHYTLANAANRAFACKVTPMQYYNAFMNALEYHLYKFLTLDTTDCLAYNHFDALRESLLVSEVVNNPIAALYTVMRANVNFIRSLGEMTRHDVLSMLLKFLSELNNIHNDEERLVLLVEEVIEEGIILLEEDHYEEREYLSKI